MNQSSKAALLIAAFTLSAQVQAATVMDDPYGSAAPVSTFHKKNDLTKSGILDESWCALRQSIMTPHPEEQESQAHKPSQHLPRMVAGYNLNEVIEAAELASLAYCPMPTAADQDMYKNHFNDMRQLDANRDGSQKATITQVHPFATEYEQSGIIVEMSDGRVYVSYKGTDSLRNLATDAWGTFAYDAGTGHRCHNGFMKGFYRTKDQVFAILQDIAQRHKAAGKAGKTLEELLADHVVVTGHSLGSGLKDMFIAYAQTQYKISPSAIGFGGPRVFDTVSAQQIVDGYAGKTRGNLRVWQKGDPVPAIALGVMGYKHIHSESLELPNIGATALHLMKGYTTVLKAMLMSPDNTVLARRLTGKEVRFGFAPTKSVGIMNAKTVLKTPLPNPLYYIGKVRHAAVRYIDRPLHTAVKTVVQDTILKPAAVVVNKVADTLATGLTMVKGWFGGQA